MRRARILGAAAVLALSVAPAAGAYANPDNNGNAATAPGQAVAGDNCESAYFNQAGKPVQAGGGPKSSEVAPLNCDHYWQRNGFIGNGK